MAERNYQADLVYPYTRRRTYFQTERGDVTEFVVQLEYNLSLVGSGKEDWGTVARFDHNPSSHDGHDVVEEGLHLDLYNAAGECVGVRRGFPTRPLNKYPSYCEGYLEEKHQRLVVDFERSGKLDGLYYTPE